MVSVAAWIQASSLSSCHPVTAFILPPLIRISYIWFVSSSAKWTAFLDGIIYLGPIRPRTTSATIPF